MFPLPRIGMCPFTMVFGREPPNMAGLEFGDIKSVPVTHRQYVETVRDRLQHIGRSVLDMQAKLQKKQAEEQSKRFKTSTVFAEGMLVYLLAPSAASLSTNSKKIRADYCGPFYIDTMLDSTNCLLRSLDNRLVKGLSFLFL